MIDELFVTCGEKKKRSDKKLLVSLATKKKNPKIQKKKTLRLLPNVQIPVGRATLGRIMNVIGEPIDECGPIGPSPLSCLCFFVRPPFFCVLCQQYLSPYSDERLVLTQHVFAQSSPRDTSVPSGWALTQNVSALSSALRDQKKHEIKKLHTIQIEAPLPEVVPKEK